MSEFKTPLLICLLTTLIACNDENNMASQEGVYPINIDFSGPIPTDKKIKMKFHQGIGSSEYLEGKIERRGGYSISFPKHSYEIDLKEDLPLANLPKDDDWILNANFIDKTFLRHVISYELFMDMNLNNIAPKCRYIELSLNGEYNGLYVLMEKLDKSSLQINGKDSLSVIFKEPHIFRPNYEGISAQKLNNFHQQTYPKITKEDKSSFIESIRTLILESDETVFKNGIADLFDLSNIIDWHLLLLVSNNNDGLKKNFYLYKQDSQTLVRIAPWDYDHSFGRDGDNELNLDVRPVNMEQSILFARLLKIESYKLALKKRWYALNENSLLSEEGLKERILRKSKLIKPFAEKNFKLWPLNDQRYYDDNNFDQEIEIMLEFVTVRHKRLEEYFRNF